MHQRGGRFSESPSDLNRRGAVQHPPTLRRQYISGSFALWRYLPVRLLSQGGLVGAIGAEEAEDDSGGSPIAGLGGVRAERSPVIVDVEKADFEMPGWVNIQAAAHLIGNAIGGGFGAGVGGVETRAANQAFGKGGYAKNVEATVGIADAVMVAVEDVFVAVGIVVAEAAVTDDLEPGLKVVTESADAAHQIGGGSTACIEAGEGEAAIEIKQIVIASGGVGLLPALAGAGATDRLDWLRVGGGLRG